MVVDDYDDKKSFFQRKRNKETKMFKALNYTKEQTQKKKNCTYQKYRQGHCAPCNRKNREQQLTCIIHLFLPIYTLIIIDGKIKRGKR